MCTGMLDMDCDNRSPDRIASGAWGDGGAVVPGDREDEGAAACSADIASKRGGGFIMAKGSSAPLPLSMLMPLGARLLSLALYDRHDTIVENDVENFTSSPNTIFK